MKQGIELGKDQMKNARSEDISAYTGLSVTEVEDLKKNLNCQMFLHHCFRIQ